MSDNWVHIEVVGFIDRSAGTATATLAVSALLSNLGFQM